MSIFVLFTLLSSIVFFVEGFRGLLHGFQSVNWPVVNATIISSHVEEVKTGGGSNTSTFIAKIHYVYEIQGRIIKNGSGTISLNSSGSSSWRKAHTIVNRFPVGKKVDICHHPRKLELSCVASEAGFTITPLVLFAASSVFLYLGLVLLRF